MKEFLTGERSDKQKGLAVVLWDVLGTSVGEKVDPEVRLLNSTGLACYEILDLANCV